MSVEALTGADVIQINGRILTDLADGDTGVIEFPNDVGNVKTGKNGNSIFAFNATGRNANLTLRVMLGSADDKYLNSLLQSWIKDSAAFTTMNGQFVKKVGDGVGNVNTVTYDMTGGIFRRPIAVKENMEGDTEQAVAVYQFAFADGKRSIA